jgi:ubiquinone/menaquinone biosynthesis C-methylase UbiE
MIKQIIPEGKRSRAHMDNKVLSWDADYLLRGRLWGGQARNLPVLPPGSRILELGCGDGKTFSALQECGWDSTALDFSRQATRMCRQNAGELKDGVITADARSLPFRTGSFDAVLAFHCIGHSATEDRRTIAGEIFRVLLPGGVLLFCEFSTHDLRFGFGERIDDGTFRRGNGITTHFFTRDDITSLFSGYSPVSVNDHDWTLRVRGKNLPRSEIHGIFMKPSLSMDK